MKKITIKLAFLVSIASLLFVVSCSKHDDCKGGAPETEDQKMDRRVKTMINKLPIFKYKSAPSGNSTGLNTLDGFSFSNPTVGYNYSSVVGYTYAVAKNIIFLYANSFGSNRTGGTVVAGSSSLDINYTFCFTSDDQTGGVNLFSTNAPTSGTSGVIGVSGDFEALADANDSTSFSDIFHGLAFYFVYDSEASGTYDVIDWSTVDWNDSTSIDQKCFAFVFDFATGKLYMSLSGTLTVNGGIMDFNGDYLAIEGFILDNDGLNLDDIHYRRVSGFGAMGCN